jgi:hypothetical protein
MWVIVGGLGLLMVCSIGSRLGSSVADPQASASARASSNQQAVGALTATPLSPATPTRTIPTPTRAVASPTPVSPTPTNRPAATSSSEQLVQDQFISGGLGVSRQVWESRHGQPDRDESGAYFHYGNYIIRYEDERVIYLVHDWKADVSFSAARVTATSALPADSTLVQSVTTPEGLLFELYTSESLTSRFNATEWTDNEQEPGTIGVLYYSDNEGTVSSLDITLGHEL